MKGKQIAALLMAGVLAFGGTACGSKEAATEPEESEVKEESSEPQENEPEENGFSIRSEIFEEGNVHIEYPQVENLVNQEITDWYNKQFQSAVDVHAGEPAEGDLAANSDMVEETFQVTYQSEEMISILIEGYFYAMDAAHPSSFMYSYNINLKTGESMSITDEYEAETLADAIISGQDTTGIEDVKTLEPWSGEKLEYARQELQEKNRDFTLEALEKCDYTIRVAEDGTVLQPEECPYLYSVRLKDGAWAVCMDVSHALGDYVVVRYDK